MQEKENDAWLVMERAESRACRETLREAGQWVYTRIAFSRKKCCGWWYASLSRRFFASFSSGDLRQRQAQPFTTQPPPRFHAERYRSRARSLYNGKNFIVRLASCFSLAIARNVCTQSSRRSSGRWNFLTFPRIVFSFSFFTKLRARQRTTWWFTLAKYIIYLLRRI